MNPLNAYSYKNLALVDIAESKIEDACANIDISIKLGFVNEYGREVIELRNEHCIK